ncbi:MAG: hypothetical protein FWD53_12570 [Phycisphaerales bacterium]|nr:hypothetical protein [Phycisphaerales bacterium]
MDFGDGKGFRLINACALERLPNIFEEEVAKVLHQAAEIMVGQIWSMYQAVIRERPRKEGTPIKDVIYRALQQQVAIAGPVIEMDVFNLEYARRETQGPEWGKSTRSIFEALEEGYSVRHPWGFMPLDLANHLAERASFMLSESKRAAFKARIAEAFAGRHGEGIMVLVDKPLFYETPDFGTPLEFGILPHSGWEGWHVLKKISGPNLARRAAGRGESHWLLDLLDHAMAQTVRRIQ